ncbi:hypothetical protein [Paraburkholderia sp.]|uniref:hypothetical protein n=1 Tax=Paraburkholderia sp. TaxID=1926495 RepID=UPI0039E3290B
MGSERQSGRGRERALTVGASGRIDTNLFARQPLDIGSVRKRVEGTDEKNWGKGEMAAPGRPRLAGRT